MFPEKNVTEFFCDADAAADDDDRSDPYMSPPLKRAGDTINNKVVFAIIKIIIQKIKSRKHVVNSIPKLHNFFWNNTLSSLFIWNCSLIWRRRNNYVHVNLRFRTMGIVAEKSDGQNLTISDERVQVLSCL